MITEYRLVIDERGLPKLEEKYTYDYVYDDSCDIEYLYMLDEICSLGELESESAYLVAMDYYRKPIGIYQISIGDYKSCNIYTRTTVTVLLLLGARSFIVAHNHPDRVCEASVQDIANEQLFETISNMLGIEFDGSFVLTMDGWCKIPDNKMYPWI